MDGLSKLMLYVILGIPAFFVGIYILALGPLGWFALAFVLLGAMAVQSWGDDRDPPVRTNCSECGAPNPTDRDRCKHCTATLDPAGDN